jgi:hypothetical protein
MIATMRAIPITFDQALEETARTLRHLLLGNGFSIGAYRGFSYTSLNEEACKLDPSIEPFLPPGVDIEEAMRRAPPVERARLRQVLIETITQIHPRRSDALTIEQRKACADFLATFFRRRTKYEGRVFTTNYDLLLYWVIMARKVQLQSCGDGFGHNFTWHGDRDRDARVLYLHGGVHLYAQASNNPHRPAPIITKLQAGNGPASGLISLVRSRVNRGDIPIVVSEGTAADKVKRIGGNDYLCKASQRFHEACDAQDAALFVYGHGLGSVDSHIIKAVTTGRIRRVYVGWYSDTDRERFDRLADWWRQKRAETGHPIEVSTFDAKLVSVWTSAR